MSSSAAQRSPNPRKPCRLQKPNGQMVPRVRKVGPEHFGIVAVDCAKARSKWLHPCCQQRHYILGKLPELRAGHRTPPEELRQDLEAAVQHLPAKARAEGARPLQERLDALAQRRRGGPPNGLAGSTSA